MVVKEPPNVRARLEAAARRAAKELSIDFSEGSNDLVFSAFIPAGVARLEAEGNVDENSIQLAERNIDRLIAVMHARAREVGYAELHEDTFAYAERGLCPIWPFC